MRRLAWILGVLAMGCGASGAADTSDTADGCFIGETRDCECDGGVGTEVCSETGWEACICEAPNDARAPYTPDDAGLPDPDAAAVCGDNRCEASKGETCENCPADCGECAECDLAPNCTGAFSVPIEFEPLPEFNNNEQTSYGVGLDMGIPPEETTCSAPRLKLQLSRVTAHKDGLSFAGSGGFKVFCLVEASDGSDSELILTPSMDLKGDGKFAEINATNGTFWGQGKGEVKQSQFNVAISYTCYRDKDGDVWSDVLKGISDAAGAGAGIPGNPYGWAFGLGSVAAAAAEATIQKAGLTNVLSVEQRIAKDALLLLTHGKTWSIRQKGKFDSGWGSEKSDIELTVRAWGCSSPRPNKPH